MPAYHNARYVCEGAHYAHRVGATLHRQTRNRPLPNDRHMTSTRFRFAGQTIHRRHHRKADGRDLWLYGTTPHRLPPLAEMPPTPRQTAVLRHHPLRDEWIVFAAHRQQRTFQPDTDTRAADPLAPTRPQAPQAADSSPPAAGASPTEIPFADFEIAVFDNRFAPLHPHRPADQSPDRATAPAIPTVAGISQRPARGHCEVVVYTSAATGSLASLGQARRMLLLATWIDRYRTLRNAGHTFVMPFENRGAEAGATLHHPHGQIYAFDLLPQVQKRAAQAFADGYDLNVARRDWGEAHHIGGDQHMAMAVPPFARFPYEAWIVPTRRSPGPWDFTDEECASFAHHLGDLVARYDTHFGRATPFMMTLHAAPLGTEADWHFTTQFYPLLRAPDRLKYFASVEQATGIITADIMPHTAAAALRQATPPSTASPTTPPATQNL